MLFECFFTVLLQWHHTICRTGITAHLKQTSELSLFLPLETFGY